jgi:hypothetical protein
VTVDLADGVVKVKVLLFPPAVSAKKIDVLRRREPQSLRRPSPADSF